MKKIDWRIKFSLSLILASVLIYSFHYFVFQDPHHIFIYLVGDLAFIPMEVLLVSLVIDKMIGQRELKVRLEKLNLVIGIFFNEVGTSMLKQFIGLDQNVGALTNSVMVTKEWSEKEYKHALRNANNHCSDIDVTIEDLKKIKSFLLSKRDFLLKLLGNQNLLEHETFTELLYSLFHLEEELSTRDLSKLSKDDIEHLKVDIKRVYDIIISQWILYMKYLQKTFPYFFTTAVSNNPFYADTEESEN